MSDKNEIKSRALALASVLGALAMLVLLASTAMRAPVVDISNDLTAQVALRQAITEMAQEIPALNSAGDSVYAELLVRDDTGVVTTPTDGGVYAPVLGAPMALGESDGSGCITASLATGRFTAARRCALGEWLVAACVSDFAGAGNASQVTTAGVALNGTVVTTAPLLRRQEPVDAGGSRNNFGCVQAIVVIDEVGDYVDVRLANSGATGVAATTRSASFRVQKLLSL